MDEEPKAIKKPTMNRLTVVEIVYHQSGTDDATSVETRFSKMLESEEQLYSRTLKLTEAPISIDSGWLTEFSMLIIKHREGNEVQVQFDDSTHSMLIGPGESLRCRPSLLDALAICCVEGEARVTITLIPK